MSATIKAGSNITAYWDKTFDHPTGPLIVWMTECGLRGACSKTKTITNKSWFKIAQTGLGSGSVATGRWGSADMMKNNFSYTAEIPNSIPDGDYLIRHEIIDLAAKPTAYYMQCAQVTIFNDGGEVPDDKFRVKIPGVYKSSDPNLNIANWKEDQRTSYTIPGPPVYSGGQAGGTGYIPGWAPVGSGIVPTPHAGGGGQNSAPPGMEGDPANAADVTPPQPTGNPAKAPSPFTPKGRPKGWGPKSGGQQAPENGLPRKANVNLRVANGLRLEDIHHPTGLYGVKDGSFVLGYGDIGWRP
jgi:Auxiliary Activity family 9 (formerly GH61)